eukprot:6717782-Prymnesium_polylepis.1
MALLQYPVLLRSVRGGAGSSIRHCHSRMAARILTVTLFKPERSTELGITLTSEEVEAPTVLEIAPDGAALVSGLTMP